MRREAHDTHAANRDAQEKGNRANEEPLKRSYERAVNGEAPVDDADDGLLPSENTTAAASESVPAAEAQPSAADVDAEVAQELASISGSSPARYGSLKGKDHNV